ncbi:MAG: metallophosphoesterase family protein [Bacteroidota bacterium]
MMKYLSLIIVLIPTLLSGQIQKEVGLPLNVEPKDRISFCLYTVNKQQLKLTAQFYPIRNFEPFEAILQMDDDGQWIDIDTAEIVYPGYTAHFKVVGWDDSKTTKYRVAHNETAFYEGLIQKNPVEKDEIVVGAFSGNSIYSIHGGDLSRQDIVDNMKKIKPDLLFFAGDQVYDHSEHYWHWLRFGQDFGEIISNTPTVCLPDDHDVGQANIWGAGGKKGINRYGEMGGYYMPLAYIEEVQRAQSWHLPDAYDPTPIGDGISVLYTNLTWGGISFAIIEDRKWKSGPDDVLAGINRDSVDVSAFDVAGAKLLGERQLKFLEDWTDDWENAEMKAVLSATVFAQTSTRTGKHDWFINYDFDANGWPQTGRNKALEVIRKSYAVMIGGDQHLATVIQHGIEDWGDAGYSFATPSIASLWLRWWDPKEDGKNRPKGEPRYIGEFEEGFKNKITMVAVANPDAEPDQEDPDLVNSRGAGIGVVRFNKSKRTVTFECWPRKVDITEANQFYGWPVTVNQLDNNQVIDGYQLPHLILDVSDAVVSVYDQSKQLISSLRIKGNTYQPEVRKKGLYDISIRKGTYEKTISQLPAKRSNKKKIKITLR